MHAEVLVEQRWHFMDALLMEDLLMLVIHGPSFKYLSSILGVLEHISGCGRPRHLSYLGGAGSWLDR